jgi:hypothetical protein
VIYLRQGKAATLSLLPKEGRGSSVTVTFSDANGAVVSSGTATESATATTLAAAASRGARQVTLTSASGFLRLDTYQIGGDGEGLEHVVIDRLDGNVAYLVDEIRYPYDNGATFRSTRWGYSLTTDDTATVGLYHVEWQYTALSIVRYHSDVVRVVARPLSIPVTAADLLADVPSSNRRAAGLPDEVLLARAHAAVVADFAARGLDPDKVRDSSALVPLVVASALLILAKRWARTDPNSGGMAREMAAAEYQAEWERILEPGLVWYDRNADGVQDDSEVGGVAGFTYFWEKDVRGAL